MNRDKVTAENKTLVKKVTTSGRTNTKKPENIDEIIKSFNESSIKSLKLKKLQTKKILIQYLKDKYGNL